MGSHKPSGLLSINTDHHKSRIDQSMSTPHDLQDVATVVPLRSPVTPSPVSSVFKEFPRRNYAASSVSTSSKSYLSTPQTPHSQDSSGSNSSSCYSIDISLDNMTAYVANLPHSHFKTTLGLVARKLLQAMKATRKNHKDFYFWVCDFLGSLTQAIDMFGPIPKPQYIRDFTQVSWILRILDPFLLLALDKSIPQPLGHAQITAFTETCVVLKSVVSKYRKLPCIYKDLIEELWELIIEILAETDQGIIINYSFSLCQTIVGKVPLCDELVCKLVLVRAITINYGAPHMTRFRILHARLLEKLVLRALKTEESQYIDDIASEIVRCITVESNPEALQTFKHTLLVSQGKTPAIGIKEATSVANFRDRRHSSGEKNATKPHRSTQHHSSKKASNHHRKDPRAKSTQARISLQSAGSTQSSPGNITLRTSISKPELPIPPTEKENANSFQGYREFRPSVRKSIVTKLKSWRNVLNGDPA